MFTSVDKALVAVVMGILYLLNSVLGINIGIEESVINGFLVAITPVLVWFFPNKQT